MVLKNADRGGLENLPVTRRRILALMGMGVVWAGCRGMAFAAAPTGNRFVFIIMRGAMDGLAAVPPLFDPHYASARGTMSMLGDREGGQCLPLDGHFVLHPALANMHKMFQARECLIAHAVASPYRERSHFDGQDILENGAAEVHGAHDGWLGRALVQLAAAKGLAVGQNIPLALRGGGEVVTSWSPGILSEPGDDLLGRLGDLYQDDPVLARALARARETEAGAVQALDSEEGAPGDIMDIRAQKAAGKNFPGLTKIAGKLLAAADGPRIGVIEIGGWDTHAGQGTFKGRLANNLLQFDKGIAALRAALGPVWRQTVVVCATEFGRTVAANGTGGTDHGTGTAAFILGGAVAGGKIIADWPGLAANQLYENRDLRPTRDLRAVLKGVLAEHMGIDHTALNGSIFPDSDDIRPVGGIVRA